MLHDANHNRIIMRKLACLMALTGCLTLVICDSIAAEQKPGSMSITPALSKIVLQKNQTQQTAIITVKNSFAADLAFTAEVTSVDDTRGTLVPKLTGRANPQQNITISPSTFELPAGKSINLQVTISDNNSLPPGGSYAAVVIQQKQAPTENVGVQAALSAGIFIIKEDGAIRQISATKPDIKPVRFSLPSVAETTFHNDGNVQLIPRASTMYMTDDTVIGKAVFNTESASIMPGKSLRLRAPIMKLHSPLLPHRIKVTVYPRYDDALADAQPLTTHFWYIPLPFLSAFSLSMCTIIVINKKYQLLRRCRLAIRNSIRR